MTATKRMLNELEAPSKPLTKWEESFLASVTDQYECSGSLSERQFEILEHLWVEKTT